MTRRIRFNLNTEGLSPEQREARYTQLRETLENLEPWEEIELICRRNGISMNLVRSTYDAVSAVFTSEVMERLESILEGLPDDVRDGVRRAAVDLALSDGAVKRRMEARRKALARAEIIAQRNSKIVEDARRLLATGATRKQVANRLAPEHGLSPRTVQNLLSRLL